MQFRLNFSFSKVYPPPSFSSLPQRDTFLSFRSFPQVAKHNQQTKPTRKRLHLEISSPSNGRRPPVFFSKSILETTYQPSVSIYPSATKCMVQFGYVFKSRELLVIVSSSISLHCIVAIVAINGFQVTYQGYTNVQNPTGLTSVRPSNIFTVRFTSRIQ